MLIVIGGIVTPPYNIILSMCSQKFNVLCEGTNPYPIYMHDNYGIRIHTKVQQKIN